MNKKLEIIEQKRKNLLATYWTIFIIATIPTILSLTGVLSLTPIDDVTTIYQLELLTIALLACTPIGIKIFNSTIKKADKEDINKWCSKYLFLVRLRTIMCISPAVVGGAAHLISQKESFLYCVAFGLISALYVYPSKHEIIKLLNGESDK